MSRHFAAVCLALLPFAQCIQIHKHMTQEEVRTTFQAGHDTVPDYEVVRLYHTLHKRDIESNSTRTVKYNAQNRDISLYFEPTEGLLIGESTPVWTVVPDAGWPERTRYTRRPNVLANIGRAYQDVSKMSAIVAYEGEDGEILVHGNLLDNLVIRPLPHRLHNTVLREARSLDDSVPNGINGEDFQRSHHHVVFKRRERDINPTHGDIRVVKRESKNPSDSAHVRSRRSMPDVVYPEILLIVDYSLYEVLGENLEYATRYVLAFWNAVDLRYRLLEDPIIRLNIAGIIISVKPGGTPYLEDYKRGSTDVDADLALAAMGHYFYRESYRFQFKTYDMAVAMTHLDMCNIGLNGICDKATLGYAYEWGACNRSHIDMNTEAVGMVEDNGGYSAIIPAAHEVAHLMGAPHDGFKETINCPSYHGYIMSSALNHNENSFLWSNCSLKYFYDYLSSSDGTCVYTKPKTDKALVRLLPGQLLTLDEQCEKVEGTRACYYDERVCTALNCSIPGMGGKCKVVSAAAEGSPCGDDLYCINGLCVSTNVTTVPYTLSTTLKPIDGGFRRPGFLIPPRRNPSGGVSAKKTNEEVNNSFSETNDR